VATWLYWPTDSRANFVPLSRAMYPVLEFTAAVGGAILLRGWSSTSVNPKIPFDHGVKSRSRGATKVENAYPRPCFAAARGPQRLDSGGSLISRLDRSTSYYLSLCLWPMIADTGAQINAQPDQ
jgi:hypothetical protein